MKRIMLIMVVVLACVVGTSTVSAQCYDIPDGYTSTSLEKVRVGGPDGMMEVGIARYDGSVVPTWVPKDSKFALKLLSKEGTTEVWEIGYYCNGYCWVGVENQPLRIEANERPSHLTLPEWYTVEPGQGWLAISQNTGVDVDSLKKWNHIGDRNPYQGEHYFIERPVEEVRRWEYLNGDPAGIPLIEQIELMDVPDYVRQHWRSLIEATAGDTVWVYSHPDSPLVVNGIIFGGRNDGSAVKIWGKTAFLWKDVRTSRPIYQQLAIEYSRVDYEGKRYLLQQYLVCDNGAYKVVDLEYTGHTETVSRAATLIYTESSKPKEPERSREFVQGGVVWLDEAYYRGGDDELWGSYFGVEWMPRLSGYDGALGLQDLMAVLRTEQAYSDCNHGSDYRLGLRGNVYGDEYGWAVYLEGGGWYNASQRSYIERTPVSPRLYQCEEKGAYVDDYGWHARMLGVTPARGYFDFTYRQGTNLDRAWDMGLTFEPDWFYSNVSYGLRQQEEQSRHIDGETYTFCADTIQVVEVRLGIKPSQKWVIYGSYEWWVFDSDAWDFRWEGPGIGVEHRPNRLWRFKASYKFLPDGKDYDRIAGLTYETDRHWLKAGLVYSW